MEESIKLQEEFENLIHQLEKLKKINEITTLNTEAAAIVIKETKTFAKNATNYFSKLETNLNSNSKDLDKLISTSQSSLKQLNVENSNNYKKFEELLDGLKFRSNFDTIKQFNVANNEFLKVIQSQNVDLKDDLNKIINDQNQNIDITKKLIQTSNSELSILLKKQNELFEKKFIQLNEQTEFLKKGNKVNQLLLFFICSVIAIGVVGAVVGFAFIMKHNLIR